MKIETFNTKRLILKKFTPQVYEFFFKTKTNNEIKALLGLGSMEEVNKEIERHQQGAYHSFKNLVWFQLIETDTETIIGYCGFHLWNKQHNKAELGYFLLHDNYKQKGFMSEALTFILNYGFTEMNLNRVEAFTEPSNIASIKSLKKFGFNYEGLCKQHYYSNNEYTDSSLFALLKQDY